jgi:hypothetical protein
MGAKYNSKIFKNNILTKYAKCLYLYIIGGSVMKLFKYLLIIMSIFVIGSFNSDYLFAKDKKKDIKDITELLLTEPVELSPIGDVTQLNYIMSKAGSTILSIDGSAINGSWTFVSPGTHVLMVQYYTINSYDTISYDTRGRKMTETHRTESKSEPMRIQYTFEISKNYYLEYEIEKGATIFNKRTINFSITELMDKKEIENGKKRLVTYEENYKNAVKTYHANVEKRQQFFAFSEANPSYLEGTWKGNLRLMKPLFLIFTGNHIKVNQDNFGPDINYEGIFYYDDKTIIIKFEKNNKSQIWQYEMKDGYLNILNGKIFATGWNIKAQYVKEK